MGWKWIFQRVRRLTLFFPGSSRMLGARGILANFLIGAHALQGGVRLLTLHEGLYHGAFPRLTMASVRGVW
jgi:hypothetical protein